MDGNKAIALVVVLILLTFGMIIPSATFISKNIDFQHMRATTRLCCE